MDEQPAAPTAKTKKKGDGTGKKKPPKFSSHNFAQTDLEEYLDVPRPDYDRDGDYDMRQGGYRKADIHDYDRDLEMRHDAQDGYRKADIRDYDAKPYKYRDRPRDVRGKPLDHYENHGRPVDGHPVPRHHEGKIYVVK